MLWEREEETVDAGAAIVADKGTSLEARPLFCIRVDMRSADSPASICGAIVEGETEETVDEDDDEEEEVMINGTRDGATARRMVSRELIRS